VALVAAFSGAPALPQLTLPALPCPASELVRLGVVFAHRLHTTIGAEQCPVLADFNYGPGRILLPADAATGKPGMSFFLTTCETPVVVQAAHAFRGAARCGCSAYPLDKVPLSLSLVVDRVLVSRESDRAPVLLHASLAPARAMSGGDFVAALRQWQGVLPCAIEGSAGDARDSLIEHDGGEACGGGGCSRPEAQATSEAQALVASAAAKLAARAAATVQPAGGSPGMHLGHEQQEL
jgi:hypothetical protein